jgi:hypothetical protein
MCVCLCVCMYLSIYSCCSHLKHKASVKRFVSLQFLNLRQSAGLLGRGISPTQARYLHRTTQTQNKRRQISMPSMRFEPTIPAFEREKTFHALDRANTVIGCQYSNISCVFGNCCVDGPVILTRKKLMFIRSFKLRLIFVFR